MALESPLLHDGGQCTSSVNADKTTAAYYGINSSGVVPGAASGSGQYLFVTISGGRTVAPNGSAGGQCYGILQNAPKTGQAADVGILGISKVVTGSGGVTAGSPIASDANGCAVVWASGGGKAQMGWALETVAANAVATVFLWGAPAKVLT